LFKIKEEEMKDPSDK